MRIVIDATNGTLGRLCSFAAKQALLGKEVIIVNCNEVVITGSRKNILNHYTERRAIGGTSLKGPFYPKIPERIVKRTGMISIVDFLKLVAEDDNIQRELCNKENKS